MHRRERGRGVYRERRAGSAPSAKTHNLFIDVLVPVRPIPPPEWKGRVEFAQRRQHGRRRTVVAHEPFGADGPEVFCGDRGRAPPCGIAVVGNVSRSQSVRPYRAT